MQAVLLSILSRFLALILPALFPSWRFFRSVHAPPRVEVRAPDGAWVEALGRPERLGLGACLGRLFWNPGWNETLFIVALAERCVEDPSPRVEALLSDRLARRLGAGRRWRVVLDGAVVLQGLSP